LAANPPFVRATVVLPQAVTQLRLDLCPQQLLLQEKVEDSPDQGWLVVSMH
jgi:hypothetical protein